MELKIGFNFPLSHHPVAKQPPTLLIYFLLLSNIDMVVGVIRARCSEICWNMFVSIDIEIEGP